MIVGSEAFCPHQKAAKWPASTLGADVGAGADAGAT